MNSIVEKNLDLSYGNNHSAELFCRVVYEFLTDMKEHLLNVMKKCLMPLKMNTVTGA